MQSEGVGVRNAPEFLTRTHAISLCDASSHISESQPSGGWLRGKSPSQESRFVLDQTLRQLVQRLGEAIHDSVAESEQIGGVVQEIRRYGFDVLLMLEATIGLNQVESADAESGETDGEGDGTFTAQDVHFLRSLRIAVEGDEPDI